MFYFFMVMPPLHINFVFPGMELFYRDNILIHRMMTSDKLHHCYFDLSSICLNLINNYHKSVYSVYWYFN